MLDSFPGVVVCEEVGAADWVLGALQPRTHGRLLRVSSLVPAGYAAYGRILHRVCTTSGDVIRWGEIARRTGRTLHGGTRYNELVGWRPDAGHQAPPAPWGEPDDGSLSPGECAAAAEVLARFTTTPHECWFCMWEGYGTGWPVLNRLAEHAPRVGLEHRSCLLFRGPVAAATAFRSEPWFQSPTLWWPEDRAWCVATDIDGYSTYLAATPASLRGLIAHPSLEVVECTSEQEIDPSPYPGRDGEQR